MEIENNKTIMKQLLSMYIASVRLTAADLEVPTYPLRPLRSIKVTRSNIHYQLKLVGPYDY